MYTFLWIFGATVTRFGAEQRGSCSGQSCDDFALLQSIHRQHANLSVDVHSSQKAGSSARTMAPAGAGFCLFGSSTKKSMGRAQVGLCLDGCLQDPDCIAADVSTPGLQTNEAWKRTPWLATAEELLSATWPGLFWQPLVQDYHNQTTFDCNHYSSASGTLTVGGASITDNATCFKKRGDYATLHYVSDCAQCQHQLCSSTASVYEVNVPLAESLYGWIGPSLAEWGCGNLPATPRTTRNSKSGKIYVVEESSADAEFMFTPSFMSPPTKASPAQLNPLCWALHDLNLPGTYKCLDGTTNRCPGNATISTWGLFRKSDAVTMLCSAVQMCYCERPEAPLKTGNSKFGCGANYLTVDYSQFSCPAGSLCLATAGFKKADVASACMPVTEEQPVCACLSQEAAKAQMKGRQCYDGPSTTGDSSCFGFSLFLDTSRQFDNGSIPFYDNVYWCSDASHGQCEAGEVCASSARKAKVNASQLCKPAPGPCACQNPFASAAYSCGRQGALKQCGANTVCSTQGAFDLSEAAKFCLPSSENLTNALLSEVVSAIQGTTFVYQSGNNDCPDSPISAYNGGFDRSACASSCPPSTPYMSIDFDGNCRCCTALTANVPGNGRSGYMIVRNAPTTYGDFQSMAQQNLSVLLGMNTVQTIGPIANFSRDPCSIYFVIMHGFSMNISNPASPSVQTITMEDQDVTEASESFQACRPGLEASVPVDLGWNLTYIGNLSILGDRYFQNQKFIFKVYPRVSVQAEALVQGSRSEAAAVRDEDGYADFSDWLKHGPWWQKYLATVPIIDFIGLESVYLGYRFVFIRNTRSAVRNYWQQDVDNPMTQTTQEEMDAAMAEFEEQANDCSYWFWNSAMRRYILSDEEEEAATELDAGVEVTRPLLESAEEGPWETFNLFITDTQQQQLLDASAKESEEALEEMANRMAEETFNEAFSLEAVGSEDSVSILSDSMSAARVSQRSASEGGPEISAQESELLDSLEGFDSSFMMEDTGILDAGFDGVASQAIGVDGFAGAAEALTAGEAALFTEGVEWVTTEAIMEVLIPVVEFTLEMLPLALL
eukprot:TRINITY_DN28745_c0_g1_i1.p1 TRINITY_DN28745_c0_g1~~TRINITY_DN28745_c0_g1_i1.p1  ORF type:complete len:1078 (-),score=141.57 TRINITY_DN28745_c0_g1_i1:131-3313(-)